MSSRFRFTSVATLALLLAFASTSVALEKRVSLLNDTEHDTWTRGTTPCRVTYFNICTGWIWVWGSWSPGDQLGTAFSSCCPGGYGFHQLLDAELYAATGSPSGYGFTGTLDVWTADANRCPSGPALRSQPFLPVTGWNFVDWSSSPVDVSAGDFIITYTLANATLSDPVTIATDHPAMGPTGPAACGSCFPTTRVPNSFLYVNTGTTYCPGATLFDGSCDAEFLLDCDLMCATPVQQTSWGQIKNLYQ
jgi:hypothetical protein